MSDYQERLTQARRDALWRALVACKRDRERDEATSEQLRHEHARMAAWAVAWLVGWLVIGLVMGAGVAVWQGLMR